MVVASLTKYVGFYFKSFGYISGLNINLYCIIFSDDWLHFLNTTEVSEFKKYVL